MALGRKARGMVDIGDDERKLFTIIFLLLLTRFLWFNVIIERDEGIFGYVASRMLKGDMLYRDVYDTKPPVLYLAYAGVMSVFGNSIFFIRLMGNILFAISLAIMFYLVRMRYDRTKALLATIFMGLLLNVPSIEGFFALSESIALPFLLLSIYFLLKEGDEGRVPRLVASSLLLAIAVLINQFYIFIAGFHLFTLLRSSSRMKDILIFAGTGASVFLAVLAYFLANDAGAQFISIFLPMLGRSLPQTSGLYSIVESLEVYSMVRYSTETLSLVLLQTLGFFFLLAVGIVVFIQKRDSVSLAFLVFSIISGFLPPAYGHYIIRAVPAMSIACAEGFIEVRRSKKHVRRFLYVVLGGLFAASLYFQSLQYPHMNFSRNGITWRYNDYAGLDEQMEISRYIRDNTDSTDRIVVWGFNLEIYWLSGRDATPIYEWTHDCRYYTDEVFSMARSALLDEETGPAYVIFPPGYPRDCMYKGMSLLDDVVDRDSAVRIGRTDIMRTKV